MDQSPLAVGLKEWAVVCQALRDGRQIVLLRKGGIHEVRGRFEVAHPRFVLFPTYLHQKPMMLKPEFATGLAESTHEPDRLVLSVAAEVTDIVPVPSRAAIDRIRPWHIWSEPLIDLRFAYKPANPLYLMVVRAWRLAGETTIANAPEYAGCKSWVPLRAGVELSGATAVLDTEQFDAQRKAILTAMWTD